MINFWAVLVAAIANMLIGSLWYGPLFGKRWVGYVGWSEEKLKQVQKGDTVWPMVAMFAGALVMATVLAHILTATTTVVVSRGLMVGFGLWLGFVATTHLGSVLFEKRPQGYYWLTTFHYLAVLLVDSSILVLWR